MGPNPNDLNPDFLGKGMRKEELRGIAAIVGTVVGAGTLGIPYVFAQSGFLTGLLTLIIVGFMSTLVMLYTAEIVLRTREIRQMPGLAAKYLGKRGKHFMLALQVIGIYGALMAYLAGIGVSFRDILGGDSLLYSTLFLIFAFPVVYKGLRMIEEVEGFLLVIKVLLISILCLLLLPEIKLENLSQFDLRLWLYPYGVLMFAWSGYTVIPNLERIMEKDKKRMKKVILLAMFFCFLIYFGFALAFVGALDGEVEEIATESMKGDILASLFAIFLLSTPFLILSWVLKDIFKYDYKVPEFPSSLLSCVLPFLFLIAARPTFIQMLDVSGGYAVSLTYILTALMVKRARKMGDEKPEFQVPLGDLPLFFLIVMGILGMVYTTISLI